MARVVVCPYCFENFDTAEIAFRCIRPTGCAVEEDRELSSYQRLPSPMSMPRVFKPAPGWGVPTKAVCKCGQDTTKAVCPRCHNTLPGQFGATNNYTIALIGAKEAGKSHYIAVLIHELMNNVGARFESSLNALDERTIKRYKEDFQFYVYDKKEVIPATRSGRADFGVRYPMIYRLGLTRKRYFFLKQKVASTLVFFDTAGEDLSSEDIMATETRYIANSHGLIFLLDPLQIPAVRHQLGLPELLPGDAAAPGEIIFRAAELIRKFQGLKINQKIKIPVALAFSKIDEVRRILEPDSCLNRASDHDGYFDLADAEEVDATVRAYVKRWIGPNFHTTLEQNFETFRYFGVSALGAPPTSGTLPRGVQAFRVEDPFLWLLHGMGYVDGQRSKRA